MNELDKLAVKYGADKWGKHHYTPVYYEMFKDKRETSGYVIELGMGEGASLKMWSEFFPKAGILGLDNEIKRVKRFSDLTDVEIDLWPNISGDLCDQSSIRSLESIQKMSLLQETFLFVDDGSHKTSDQYLTAILIYEAMKEGSIYVIEDVSEPQDLFEMIDTYFFSSDIKLVKCGDRYDDNLIILKK